MTPPIVWARVERLPVDPRIGTLGPFLSAIVLGFERQRLEAGLVWADALLESADTAEVGALLAKALRGHHRVDCHTADHIDGIGTIVVSTGASLLPAGRRRVLGPTVRTDRAWSLSAAQVFVSSTANHGHLEAGAVLRIRPALVLDPILSTPRTP